jgi:hypothetical protein
MQIVIKGESRYIPVSTVTLQKEMVDVTYPFHCTACGNTLNVIGGRVKRIYPIVEPSDQIPVIQTCKSCKAKYIFQDGDSQSVPAITILLNPKQQKPFYCYVGGGEDKRLNKILDYENGMIYSFRERHYIQLPFTTACQNPECDVVYQFTQLS